MSEFAAIDALLAAAPEPVALPSTERRRQLREELGLSRAQVARVLEVSPSTLSGWESGRDPSGEHRTKYAYFLEQADVKVRARVPEPQDTSVDEHSAAEPDGPGADDGDADQELAVPSACVLCGQPARHQVAGYPQHLDPAECVAAVTGSSATPTEPAPPSLPPAESTAPRAARRAAQVSVRGPDRA